MIAHQDCTSNKPLAAFGSPFEGMLRDNREEALPGLNTQEQATPQEWDAAGASVVLGAEIEAL
ncbi:hypothetical protein [Nitrosospira multiformis]|uniref:hypothetical protein n=1 Tax=Nitrosospira multiformis TaxID=1231 RepID=UPI0011B26E0E|nr:hypothetical protein [Nitrosospira multiformis]